MVVVNIMMGLGNQMFQYAAARSLSLTLQEPLKLHVTSYERYTLRKFELQEFFEIEPAIATNEDMAKFSLGHPVRRTWNKVFPSKKLRSLPYEEKKLPRLVYEMFYLFSPPHKRSVYEERQFHYDNNFLKAQHTVFLKGYWMSHKYFQAHEDVIKKDFTIRKHLVEHLEPLANEMRSRNSVAVHIRCTDRKDAANLLLYGEIPKSYFEAGVEYINEKKGNLHLYIFSDDIELAKKYVPEGYDCTYVSRHITKNTIEDMYLMTQCKNAVITNSTFSWWAAYLNRHDDKIIVVPERWYNIAPFNYSDIYYPGWIKMKN